MRRQVVAPGLTGGRGARRSPPSRASVTRACPPRVKGRGRARRRRTARPFDRTSRGERPVEARAGTTGQDRTPAEPGPPCLPTGARGPPSHPAGPLAAMPPDRSPGRARRSGPARAPVHRRAVSTSHEIEIGQACGRRPGGRAGLPGPAHAHQSRDGARSVRPRPPWRCTKAPPRAAARWFTDSEARPNRGRRARATSRCPPGRTSCLMGKDGPRHQRWR